MKSRLSNSFIEIRRARPLLGTIVDIRAGGADEASLAIPVEKAFGAVARVHRLMSFHDADSDVTTLNLEAAERVVKVDAWTWQVLAEAQALFCASEGLFDIAIAPCLMRWGYLPKLRGGKRFSRQGNTADIQLLAGNCVRFQRRLAIDLGGIAKGFAVDKALAELRVSGVKYGVVNAGGDLRAFGPQSETVHVRHPDAPGQMVRLLELRDAAIATSAQYFTRKKWRGQRVSALVDAPNRRPCQVSASVSVTAPTCLVADALTKVIMAGGDQCDSILKAFKAEAFVLTGETDEA